MSFPSLLKTAMLLGCLCAAGAANAAHFLYTGGHPIDPVRMGALGDTFTEFYPNDAGWATALSGGYGPYSAIVAGEQSGYTTISASTKSAIASYVSGGGQVIIVNDHNGNTAFLNSVFGYSAVAAYGCDSSEGVGSSKTAAAVGTNFAAGPAQLRNLSCTAALNAASLPSGVKTMYAGTGTSQVFTANYGSGNMAWLGWDYCCGSTAYEDDWYIVLHETLLPSFTTCAAEGFVGAQLTLCRKICETKQTPTTLAGLLKLYKAIYRSSLTCPAAQP